MKIENNNTIKTILVIRPNHRVGNLLLITPLLQEIENILPNAKVDLFVKGNIGKILFKEYSNIDSITQLPRKPFKNLWRYIKGWFKLFTKNYDLVINANESSKSGSIALTLSRGKQKLSCATLDNTQLNGYNHMAKYPVYSFRKILHEQNMNNEVANLNLKLTLTEIEKGKEILHKLLHTENKIVCLYTFATAKKLHTKLWWKEFYSNLKITFPGFTFFELLPKENVSQLDFKIPTIYSEDLREMGGIIANTLFFIGTDSGIMHISSASQTITFGLFNVTDISIYQPYYKQSFGLDTTKHSIEDIIEMIKDKLSIS
jgi:heptosyltransferase-3